jgi:hypothetical protein
VNAVFRHFDAWIRGDRIHIREKFGVHLRTSQGWYRHWLDDPSWRSYDPRRAQRRRVFTDEEEGILAERIRTEFLEHGLLFTDADFRLMAIEQYYLWHLVDPSAEQADFKRSMASNGFVYGFKKRNHISSHRSHFKRRSPPNPEIQTKFLAEIYGLHESANRDFVLNCDEISWKLYPNRMLTWADRGSDRIVFNVTGNEKECFTVMATISLSGTKLPVSILGKGLTDRCEINQFGEIHKHQTDHSRTGWMTEETMLRYLG